jgi:phosphoglycolate phosphatase
VGDVRRLIVFDLDGTLIDSRRDLADAANALIVERGGRALPEDAIGRMVGDGAAMLVRRALTAAGLPLGDGSVTRFLELYDERLLRTTKAYPGIPEALDRLARGAVLALLTNKPLRPSQRLLEALALAPFITSVIGGDGPLPRKPDPAGLLHLIALHGSAPAATVMVGDSRNDIAAARAAGAGVCIAQYGFGFDSVGGDLREGEILARSARELPDIVQRLLSP